MSTSATILPQLNKSIVGIRYNYALFNSAHPTSLGNEFAGVATSDNFHSIEVFGRYNVKERFHITAVVPFKVSYQQASTGNTTNYGLGDLVLMGQFLAINPKLCTGKNDQHQLRIGVGLKFPTGSFNKNVNESLLHANLQNGSGSLDVLLSAIYTLRVKNWGMNTEIGYRINTRNSNQYQFGNRANAKLTAFYWWKLKENFTLLPTLGLAFEHGEANIDGKKTAPYTGGYGFNAAAGFDVVTKNIVLSLHTQPALYQHWSDGNVTRKAFVEAGIFYNF